MVVPTTAVPSIGRIRWEHRVTRTRNREKSCTYHNVSEKLRNIQTIWLLLK